MYFNIYFVQTVFDARFPGTQWADVSCYGQIWDLHMQPGSHLVIPTFIPHSSGNPNSHFRKFLCDGSLINIYYWVLEPDGQGR